MPTTHSPTTAWSALVTGNARFVGGTPEHPHADPTRRAELTAGQHPFAAVLGCSDSRVPVELVVDCGLGDVFTVRTAGHAVDASVLGSLEFAVGALGVPLVVVLGHEACGAVAATIAAHCGGTLPGGYLRDVVERVTPSVLTAPRTDTDGPAAELATVVAHHATATADLLTERSAVLREAVAEGSCAVVPARYDLAGGRIEPLAATP